MDAMIYLIVLKGIIQNRFLEKGPQIYDKTLQKASVGRQLGGS